MATKTTKWTCDNCDREVVSKDNPGRCTCGGWTWKPEVIDAPEKPKRDRRHTGGKKRAKKSFLDGYKHNFDQLLKAASSGHMVLMHCREKGTGKNVAMVTATWFDEKEQMYKTVPLARMLDGDPFEDFLDPSATLDEDEAKSPGDPNNLY